MSVLGSNTNQPNQIQIHCFSRFSSVDLHHVVLEAGCVLDKMTSSLAAPRTSEGRCLDSGSKHQTVSTSYVTCTCHRVTPDPRHTGEYYFNMYPANPFMKCLCYKLKCLKTVMLSNNNNIVFIPGVILHSFPLIEQLSCISQKKETQIGLSDKCCYWLKLPTVGYSVNKFRKKAFLTFP